MVAVRMVSEGVDIPRLCVGVYATATATPLFFAQAVGRFVRARRPGETASIFVPSVPGLLQFAADLEVQRDHVIGKPDTEGEWDPEAAALAAAQRDGRASGDLLGQSFEALDSEASFDRAVFDGAEYAHVGAGGETDTEQFFLALPGLAHPHEVGAHLRSAGRGGSSVATAPASAEPAADHRALAELRRELNALVGAYARRTGAPHATVHSRLRRDCGGPAVSQADAAQLRQRVTTLRDWLTRG